MILVGDLVSHDGSLGDHPRGAGQAHAAVPEHHAGQRVSCSACRVAGSIPQHRCESIVSNPDSLNSHAGLVLNPDLDPKSKIFSVRSLGLLLNPDSDLEHTSGFRSRPVCFQDPQLRKTAGKFFFFMTQKYYLVKTSMKNTH